MSTNAPAAQSPFDPEYTPIGRVLCFTAHPDDIDFGAAGTIAGWTAAGADVFAYFVHEDKLHAPANAIALRHRLGIALPGD